MRRTPLRTSGLPTLALPLVALLGLAGCSGDDVPPDPPLEPTYESVETIVRQSCTFSGSCHGGRTAGRGRLNFQRVFDDRRLITDVLFEVPSCEYAPYMRVAPGDPEHSWMWLKLDSETDASGAILFTPAADWDAGLRRQADGGLASSTCPLVVRGALSFGQLMPMGSRSGISPNRRRAIYEWILAGAPGPGGVMTMRDGGTDMGPRDLGGDDMDVGDMDVADMDVVDMDVDAGVPVDAGDVDASEVDAGVPVDAGDVDAGDIDAGDIDAG